MSNAAVPIGVSTYLASSYLLNQLVLLASKEDMRNAHRAARWSFMARFALDIECNAIGDLGLDFKRRYQKELVHRLSLMMLECFTCWKMIELLV
jgi:hypothetical protein